MNKKLIVAGNWKMNKTPSQGREFIHDIENMVSYLQNTEVIWPYKAILGKTVDPNFATYCKNNANIKIGKRALECIQKRHNTEGYYFFTKNEKHLMLAKIALGGSISKIIKYVSDKELHK